MKRTSFGRCEQSTPNAAICLQMAPHPPLTTRVLCHGAAFRLEGHTNPPPLFTLTVQFNYLGPPSLWRELSELSASLSLALSLFFFFSTGQYWQGIHFHMTTWVNVCIIHEGPSLLAGSTTQCGKKKQNGRLVIHFQSVGPVVWCYMRLNLFKYGLVCLMMSLCASPLPPLFPSVCSSKRFFVVIVTPFFLFFLYFCHHSKTVTE